MVTFQHRNNLKAEKQHFHVGFVIQLNRKVLFAKRYAHNYPKGSLNSCKT